MNEFHWIERYFAPLAGEEGLQLKDDAALLSPLPGKDWVITQDSLTAGIHFFADDSPAMIAQKALRVNLSDLAAKGASAKGYFLSCLLPADTQEAWVAEFARGLEQDQQRYHVKLWGGDTSRITGHGITLTITALGTVDKGKMLRRQGAKPGDILYCTGTIGDAHLGLKARKEKPNDQDLLQQRYLLPQPCTTFGTQLAGVASAALDISDGLLQDAGHLAHQSKLTLEIDAHAVPLSSAAQNWLDKNKENPVSLFYGGDDYQILFTAPKKLETHLMQLAAETQTSLCSVGIAKQGPAQVILSDAEGNKINCEQAGWQHF